MVGSQKEKAHTRDALKAGRKAKEERRAQHVNIFGNPREYLISITLACTTKRFANQEGPWARFLGYGNGHQR